MEFGPSMGKPIPYCGSSMYLGTDGKCHYYTTPNAPAPANPTPTITLPTETQTPLEQEAKIKELQKQVQELLRQIAILQAQLNQKR